MYVQAPALALTGLALTALAFPSPAQAAVPADVAAQIYEWIYTDGLPCSGARYRAILDYDLTCPRVFNAWADDRCYNTLTRDCVENTPVDADGDGWSEDDDCDDADPTINPAATEACDGIDNDCDTLVDADDPTVVDATWCPDTDRDRYGATTGCVQSCIRPRGYVSAGGDCDDASRDVNPGATEVCGNGIDDDCSGDVELCWSGDHSLTEADAVFRGVDPGDTAGRTSLFGGDYDGDGVNDLVLAALNAEARGAVYLFDATARGTYSLDDAPVRILGESTADQLGDAMDNAGDTDGDGYDDLYLGAYWHDSGAANTGAVYLLRGPIESGYVDELASAIVYNDGGAEGDIFGHSILGDVDLDGDGVGDLVAGSDLHDVGLTDAGAVFVFLGGIAGVMSVEDADAYLYGETTEAYAGHNTRSAGDTNADGYADFLVCAPYTDLVGADSGVAYLVTGPVTSSGGLAALSAAAFVGEYDGDQAGHDARSPGDLDGDGDDDLLVDIRYSDGNGTNSGAITGWFSPVSGRHDMSEADATWYGESYNDTMGVHLAAPGDMNGDGIPDFVTGSWRNDGGGSDAGTTYVVYGPMSAGERTMAEADARFDGEAAGDESGFYVSGGDLDGDGLGDFVTGSMYTGGDAGSFYLFFSEL